ncbi:uncharacterized protein LOC119090636 [Pollicipes pollicipes]|uniref:uncharacterized protein LOC119090636 n=1 Tax=Pollicipes pollicipes TaxID=41117 RepID=UPI0018850410|nr:uncharacterized protein LOC119090636 [Pollicipes pollicipes]
MFMNKARDAFYEEMMGMIRRHVSSQPCVALVVDKVALNRHTVDITVIITVVSDAPEENLVQSLVIGSPVVKDHDGESLAQELKATLATVGIESAQRVAFFAADGQYHHASVLQRLTNALNCADKDGQDEVASMPAVWDASHLINLAEQDARAGTACLWVDETIDTMTGITRRFSHGRGLEELLDTAVDGATTVTPKLWSNTRFAAHAANTMKAFRTNSETMCVVLRGRLKRERRVPVAQDLWKDISSLNDETFKTRLAALHDDYDVLGRDSRAQQNTKLLSWEHRAEYGATVDQPHAMASAVAALGQKDVHHTAEAVAQVDFEELWPNMVRYKSSVQGPPVPSSIIPRQIRSRAPPLNYGRRTQEKTLEWAYAEKK